MKPYNNTLWYPSLISVLSAWLCRPAVPLTLLKDVINNLFPDWKERKESLENVSTVLKANLAIKSEIGHDFPAGLKV